jgi:hypothetical protein
MLFQILLPKQLPGDIAFAYFYTGRLKMNDQLLHPLGIMNDAVVAIGNICQGFVGQAFILRALTFLD